MKVELYYNDKDAIKLFESQGLIVERDTVAGKPLAHGHRMPEVQQHVVINPHTGERVLLCNAMQRLFQHKLLSDMYYYDKMAVLDAINCIPVKNPVSDISNESSK